MPTEQLTVGSLFSGIGGLDLGLERAGMRVIWQSEIEPYPSKVLKRHWPDVPNHGDITQIDWTQVERPDVICGGYPCQPFSVAGKRQGTADARHLWPFFADAIRQLRPRYAILENVPGHLSLGFGDVLGDLSELGYDAEWSTISARDVGAPHLRKRLFVVAFLADAFGGELLPDGTSGDMASEAGATPCQRPERRYAAGGLVEDHIEWGPYTPAIEQWERATGAGVPTPSVNEDSSESSVRGVAHGFPDYVDSIKALGNAVVPQVAEVIGRIVVEADRGR